MDSLTPDENLIAQVARATCFAYRVDATEVPEGDLQRYVDELISLYDRKPAGVLASGPDWDGPISLTETIAFCAEQLKDVAPMQTAKLRSLLKADDHAPQIHERRARITWSTEQVNRGLPATTKTIDPSWFTEPGRGSDEGWSLVCRFASPPSDQGNPSIAQVRFLVDQAPHERLRPGTVLRLFERATSLHATIEIL